MAFVPWLDFWKEYFWKRPSHTCPTLSASSLDELFRAFQENLDSAKEVAAGAAKNVDEAEKLLQSLKAIIERKKRGSVQS